MNFKIKIYKLPDTVKVFIYGVYPDYGPMTQEITDKNDYTGMLKNKNLIVIMIESGSAALINEEYFPNIYQINWKKTDFKVFQIQIRQQ